VIDDLASEAAHTFNSARPFVDQRSVHDQAATVLAVGRVWRMIAVLVSSVLIDQQRTHADGNLPQPTHPNGDHRHRNPLPPAARRIAGGLEQAGRSGRGATAGPAHCRKATFTQPGCVNVAFLQLPATEDVGAADPGDEGLRGS
jgi:hypothetical protein